jgi:ELWxxDGT repeat protein
MSKDEVMSKQRIAKLPRRTTARGIAASILLVSATGASAPGAEEVFLVKDINTTRSSAASAPSSLTTAGERVFFTFDDGVHGRELWVTGGSEQGTLALLELPAGIGDLALRKIGEVVFFQRNGLAQYGSRGGSSSRTTIYSRRAWPRRTWSPETAPSFQQGQIPER